MAAAAIADAARPMPELDESPESFEVPLEEEELFKTTRPSDGGDGPGCTGTNGSTILVFEHMVQTPFMSIFSSALIYWI